MSRQRTNEELNRHKEAALDCVRRYLESLIEDDDVKVQSKADKLCYWLENYVDYLNNEKTFNPRKRKSYKRGEIIKADLGYNVGSEEGGLHYCVVVDKKNPLTSPVITVIPLTSVKSDTDIKDLRAGCIYIGNELFVNLSSNINRLKRQADDGLNRIKKELAGIKLQEEDSNAEENSNTSQEKLLVSTVLSTLDETKKIARKLERMKLEISRMKRGSIALTGQITTISKMRIHNPKNSNDILSGIKLSNEKLDMIDNEIRRMYTNFMQCDEKEKKA